MRAIEGDLVGTDMAAIVKADAAQDFHQIT